MKPFEYQEKAVHDLREAYKQGIRRPVLQMPTGAGKTRTAQMILESANKRERKTLFLCDKIALCEQSAIAFHKLGMRVGILQQGYRGDSNPDVLVASVQSIEKNERLPDVDLVIRDECHVLRKYDKLVMETFNNIPFIGLSATPWARGLGAPGYYETIIKGPSTQKLIDLERLTESDIWAPSKPDLEKIGIVGGEYNQKQLGEVTAKRVGEVVDQWFELGYGQQTMISAVNCADSIAICDQLNERGVKSMHVDYRTKVTEMYRPGGIIDQFKAGEIQVLSSVFKLSIGIDLPNCTCIVFAAPTKSLIRHIQFWGRGIRAYEGKQFCTVIDMVGNVENLLLNTEPTPDYLDDGEKPPTQSTEYEKREPAKCNARQPNGHICGADKKGNRTCPVCGFTPTPRAGIESVQGELVNVKKANRDYTPDQKAEFYSGLLGYAKKKAFKQGWAAWKYKDKFGVFPNHYRDCKSKEPSQEVLNFIKYTNIKRAKAK